MNRLATCAAVACLAVATGGATQAATINFNVDGVDVVYFGASGHIRDVSSADNSNGGNTDPSEADEVDGTTVRLDSTIIEQYTAADDIYADLLIKGLPDGLERPDADANPTPMPVTWSEGDNSEGMDPYTFGFEWFQHDGNSLQSSLQLDFDRSFVILTDSGSAFPFVTLQATTTEWSQFNLPGGLQFAPGTPITFSYTASNTSTVPITGTPITQLFGMDGVVTISGQAIPEPTGAYLLLSGLGAAVVGIRWRLG